MQFDTSVCQEDVIFTKIEEDTSKEAQGAGGCLLRIHSSHHSESSWIGTVPASPLRIWDPGRDPRRRRE